MSENIPETQNYIHEKVVRDKLGKVIYRETITLQQGPDGLIERIEGIDLKAEAEFENEQENQKLQRELYVRKMALNEFVASANSQLALLRHNLAETQSERDNAIKHGQMEFLHGFKTAELQINTEQANQELRLKANQQAIDVLKVQTQAALTVGQMRMQATMQLINQMNQLVGRSLSSLGTTPQIALPKGE